MQTPAPRYLTKSRFVLAVECETKLFYTGKREYADRKREDPFLAALAEGGFQVGEMAKLYFPGGREVEELEHEQALAETDRLLQADSATLYEAAIRHEDLFVRVDILLKRGSSLELVEVKSKSFKGVGPQSMLNLKGELAAEWVPYLYDVAFQAHVVALAFPGVALRCHLMLADKRAKASVEGLNQRFLIYRDGQGRPRVRVQEGTTLESLGAPLLVKVPVDDLVGQIHAGTDGAARSMPFAEWVEQLASHYRRDQKIRTPLGAKCAACEFRCSPQERRRGLKSGFEECWREQGGLEEEQLALPLVTELWSSRERDRFIARGSYLLRDLDREDLRPQSDGSPGLSVSQRQWLQVQKARSGDATPYLDREGLRAEMQRWRYPLHFIDFETTAVAIPFNRDRGPYEGVAFQFSHHRVCDDGRIEHAGQYLHREPGSFPSFDFLRALKEELEGDEGTVFRYGLHENTFLNIIYGQLRESGPGEVRDGPALCRWIETVAHPTARASFGWAPGRRDMVDLLALVRRYFYHPATGGSNSLKRILPAVLASSPHLQQKYRRPIYGKGLGIPSLNLEHWAWVRFDEEGRLLDPYRLLPPVFAAVEEDSLDRLITDPHLSEGGAAMVAYARMQFSEMSEQEREALGQALLKYCELDTLAMVMLWEYWSDETGGTS
jgi:hypothetical protein